MNPLKRVNVTIQIEQVSFFNKEFLSCDLHVLHELLTMGDWEIEALHATLIAKQSLRLHGAKMAISKC